jgi:cytochrome P450
VFKETLRLWPPAPQVSRRLEQDMEIDGLFVPKHTFVFVSI